MWQKDDNFFYKSLSLPWVTFQPPCSCVVWNKWFKMSPYFNFYIHNTNTKVKEQCKYQSSKMKTLYTMDHTYWSYTNWRYTNADLKISLYVLMLIKRIPWKFCILNAMNSQGIHP